MVHRVEHSFADAVCQPLYLEGEKRNGKTHGVLLLHGFTGSAAHMRPLAEALHARGFTVMVINLPGHASSMDRMADCTWEEWLDASKEAFCQLKEKCDYASVAGLSMGGCLALLIGEQMQPTAILPISAPMGTKAPLWLAAILQPAIKTIWWRRRDERLSPVDERYDYGYPGFRSKCAGHLSRLIKMARQNLHAVTRPVLIVQSHADSTITANSAQVILDGVSSARKGVLWLENAPHVCTISPEVDAIAERAAEHFRWAEEN